MVTPSRKTLGVVLESYGCRQEGAVHMHFSLGRVIDRLAARHEKLILCMPLKDAAPDSSRDYRLLSGNVEVIAQPFYVHSKDAVRHPLGIAKAFWRTCRKSDWLFLRGMIPFVPVLYGAAAARGCRVCHWIVGDPLACLRGNARGGKVMDALSMAYAWQDRVVSKIGRRLTGGAFVCNGSELGRIFRSPRTVVTVSSTVAEDEFFVREDTCQGERIRILYIGFVRPEKGLEYLIEAVSMLNLDRPWELVIAGRTKQWYAEYCDRLDRLVERLGLKDRIGWRGYIPYGPEMFQCFREADIFVLPTLSEGTPRVLVEARANSLPIVSTNVGGIPTSMTNGLDGLLVPPKDAGALARAIERIVSDGHLRRDLIHNGLISARAMTVDRFVDLVARVLEDSGKGALKWPVAAMPPSGQSGTLRGLGQ